MKNILTQFARIFVGVLFIFSGLIKLNDPVGFSYKLAEYFEVFGTPFMIPLSLALAVFVCIVEVLLGVMLLFGIRSRLTIWGLLLMIVFFTFLTFYSAYFNKVTDCGCFGDAIPLTPWQSFYKDIILSVLILILFFNKNLAKPVFSPKLSTAILSLSLLFCVAVTYYVINHLPIIDFRAYAVGKNIVEGMEIPEGAPQDEYEMTWIYKVDGVNQRFTTDQAPWDIPGAEFVDREQKLIKKGYEPPIHDFSITIDGEDRLPELMEEKELFLIVCYKIDKTSNKNFEKINALAAACEAAGIQIIGLSASSPEIVEQFRHDNQATFPFGSADETALKTVIRSNPGVVYIQKGTVKGQWHHNDTPTLEQARLLAK